MKGKTKGKDELRRLVKYRMQKYVECVQVKKEQTGKLNDFYILTYAFISPLSSPLWKKLERKKTTYTTTTTYLCSIYSVFFLYYITWMAWIEGESFRGESFSSVAERSVCMNKNFVILQFFQYLYYTALLHSFCLSPVRRINTRGKKKSAICTQNPYS